MSKNDTFDTPARIYLQIDTADNEITWCVDRILETDVEYIRLLPGQIIVNQAQFDKLKAMISQ